MISLTISRELSPQLVVIVPFFFMKFDDFDRRILAMMKKPGIIFFMLLTCSESLSSFFLNSDSSHVAAQTPGSPCRLKAKKDEERRD